MQSSQPESACEQRTDLSVTCSLEARGFQERLAGIAELNREHLLHSERRDSSLVLICAAPARPQIEELAAREKECCSFLSFATSLYDEQIELHITVPPGAADDADTLPAPFQADTPTAAANGCCGSCDSPVAPKTIEGTATKAVVAATATAAAACAARGAIPFNRSRHRCGFRRGRDRLVLRRTRLVDSPSSNRRRSDLDLAQKKVVEGKSVRGFPRRKKT
ncbi:MULTISPECIES: hypothetical protein [unclassified Lysobacter]|uniref:hypothetical protein n=1 Tax=unclassified Lysobacter TaxID=2635362 RepID=UPI001BE72721|nr:MULTISPECIES: hypothetical protein [unclassified Lysobacter]MBT2748702.1 hypothetical protein [Lysobacter sp. ISL-42]MBT2751637.1 hypothetical protein [Lysobacter sp. ISL-50]MBT2775831.1 hypothetical protein [Lysobacter sp. ISL-54]MBT2782204.1 hypothetical protein [Lysobacter sp. ISL-52]